MNQSEHINELASALCKSQSQMGIAKKTSNNPFFKSKYADLTEIWEVARDALGKHGLAVCHTMGKENDATVLYTTLMHSSGQWIRSSMPLICKKQDDIQALGSAITYAKRYALSAILCICTDEDDDGNAATIPPKPKVDVKKEPMKNRDDQIKLLKDVLKDCGSEYEDKIIDHYKIIGVDQLPDDQIEMVTKRAMAFREIKMKRDEIQG